MSEGATKRRWTKENRDKVRVYNRRWYRKNAEERRQYSRSIDSPEKQQARNEKFRQTNPDYWREYFQRRKLKRFWLKFATQCAESRRKLSCPT